jgi:hypothetical protein
VRDRYFRKAVFFGLTVIMAVPVVCLAALTIHTVQTGSFGSVERAERQFDILEGGLQEADLEHLRIEKIGNFYTVRIGRFDNQADVDSLLNDVRSLIGSAITITAYYREERILKLHGASSPPVSVPAEDTKEKVKDEVSPVRADIQVTKREPEQPTLAAPQDDVKIVETTEALREQNNAGGARPLGDERAVEPLIAALKDGDSRVRSNAAIALGEIGDTRAVEPLIAALKDGDSSVRSNAAIALGVIGDPRVEPLIAALKDEDSWVRGYAAIALGEIGDARAVEPLIAALKDEDSSVRRYAAEALGVIGDERALELLMDF